VKQITVTTEQVTTTYAPDFRPPIAFLAAPAAWARKNAMTGANPVT